MIRNAKELSYRKIEIDLNGPDGNAFVLLGKAKSLIRRFDIEAESHLTECNSVMEGLGFEEADTNDRHPILKEMMSSDYENLIKTFDHYFGHLVDLYR